MLIEAFFSWRSALQGNVYLTLMLIYHKIVLKREQAINVILIHCIKTRTKQLRLLLLVTFSHSLHRALNISS